MVFHRGKTIMEAGFHQEMEVPEKIGGRFQSSFLFSWSADVGTQIMWMKFKIPQSNEYKSNINNLSPGWRCPKQEEVECKGKCQRKSKPCKGKCSWPLCRLSYQYDQHLHQHLTSLTPQKSGPGPSACHRNQIFIMFHNSDIFILNWSSMFRKGKKCLETLEGGGIGGRILRKACNGVCQVFYHADCLLWAIPCF